MNEAKFHRILIFLAILSTCMATNVYAAKIHYIDRDARGSANGTSWKNAWTSFSQISGLAAGDTVYISGGPSGSSKTYSVKKVAPVGGVDGKPITYKIGQEAGHNGLAIFKATSDFVTTGNVIVSGDAGDGKRHFKFSGGTRPLSISKKNNVRISYVDCGTRAFGYYIMQCKGIEIDHNRIVKINPKSQDDFIAFMEVRGGSWGVSSFHHNDVWIPIKKGSTGIGDDGIKGSAWGLDIFNNSFVGYETSEYNAKQHMDGLQFLAGGWLRIYNNTFTNMANYAIYLVNYYSNQKNVRIYNNLITWTIPRIVKSPPPKGIVVSGRKAGNSISDFWIFNNTIVDVGKHTCIWFRNSEGDATFEGSGLYNNVCVNGHGNNVHPNVDTEANVSISSWKAPAIFKFYETYSKNNDFRLKESDSVLKDQGCSNCGANKADLKSVTTNDRMGTTQTGIWDIGAYDFSRFNAANAQSSETLQSDNSSSNTPPSDEVRLSRPDPPSQLKILAN